ncbi:MAG TPA: hypothetical protein VGX48_02885 [Pyrinomonadaceae bacterium]|jgi:hypothetical protein|nr:hypothetical protein [Pyrinomonadaceae bacterium]
MKTVVLSLLLLFSTAPWAAGAPQSDAGVRLPPGTVVELEAAHTIDSQLFRKGDRVSFRVANPVVVEGSVVIEKGATATAVLTKAERGGHFGRAGRLAWVLKEVTAVDGTRVPLEFAGREVGDSKGAKVATRVAVTGAILLPIAPVALLHGFKRGANAVVPEGKRFDAVVAAAGATVKVAVKR